MYAFGYMSTWSYVSIEFNLISIISFFGSAFQYLMDKGEKMINHEYDQLVDKDHFDHCHQCKHRRQSVSFSEQYVHLQFRQSTHFISPLEIDS